MKTNKSTYRTASESELKTQLSKEWEDKLRIELNEFLILSGEGVEKAKSRRLAKDKEIQKELEKQLNDKNVFDRELVTEAQIQDVEAVTKSLEGIDPSMIKNKGVLALVFAYMYDGITHSHPWSIKSTPKDEDKNFEADKKNMVEWIEVINFRDSDIAIHTVVPDAKPSDGLTAPDRRKNTHLLSDGWNNRYDLLIDNIKELELPSKPKTFYAKRNEWKKSLMDYGMKNEKSRATLVNAIIEFRVQVQKDLDSEEKHDKRMKSLNFWISTVPKETKELSQKLYYF